MAGPLYENLNKIKIPLGGDKVFKDECAYSFDTPVSRKNKKKNNSLLV